MPRPADLLGDLRADLLALGSRVSAPFTVRYGVDKVYAGADLPRTAVRVPTRHGRVRCEVYRPVGDVVGTYVHLHGGAFLMRYPRMDDFFCRYVAATAAAVVVNVDYDVAPFHRYPVAHYQAADVLAAVLADPSVSGVPLAADSPVAVGGFSAGGGLAASACLQVRDRVRDEGGRMPVLQLLGVPSVDVAEDGEVKRAAAPDPMLTPALLRLVRRTYFRDAARRAEPYASPLRAADLSGLPPAVVLTAERDLLRNEGDRYAARLAEAGVPVTHEVVEGADHYFLEGHRRTAHDLMGTMAGAVAEALRGGLG